MAEMEVSSELGQLNDKFVQVKQATPSLMNPSQQPSPNQSQQQALRQRAQRFEEQAQQAKEGEQRARDANNLT